MGPDTVMHFYQERLLCRDCYTAMQMSSRMARDEAAQAQGEGGPLNFSAFPEDYAGPAPPMRSRPLLALLVLLGVFGVLALGLYLLPAPFFESSPTATLRPEGDPYFQQWAMSHVQQTITRQWRVPPTAQWPRPSDHPEHVTYLGDGRYRILSWYDLPLNRKESFRQYYRGVLIRNDGKWQTQSLSFSSVPLED
jgi:hypothetical protein